MSASLTWLIIAILIFINALFVIAEIAIIASKKARLELLHTKAAKTVLQLKNAPEFFLSTVQIGVTFLNILIGMFTGKELTDDVVIILHDIGISTENSELIAYIFILISITYLTVLGEIIPKRIALFYPEKIALFIAPVMIFTGKVFFPFVKLLDLSTRSILFIVRLKKPKNAEDISIEEVRFIVKQAQTEGLFAETEHDIIRRVVNLNDMQVGAIMTPRHKLITIQKSDTKEVIWNKISNTAHTYLPTIEGDFHKILGIMSTKKYLLHKQHSKVKLKNCFVNFTYIPDLTKVSHLIEIMKVKKIPVALVVDEYGSVEGMVTISDIFKIFIHDLASLYEEQGAQVKKLKNGYIVDGNILTDEVMELIGVDSLPDEEEEDYRTLASFILKQLGRVAQVGDTILLANWTLKILSMDNFRIGSVKLTKVK